MSTQAFETPGLAPPAGASPPRVALPAPIEVWGVPFTPITIGETVAAVGALVEAGHPSHIVSANTHYAMLAHDDPSLREVNARATIILADGMPIVWASRLAQKPLPERVAGSDLIYRIAAEAAARGFRIALMGGAEGVAEEAARRLAALYPGLRIVDTICPPFGEWTAEQDAALIARVRSTRPDILITALTMPKADRWLGAHREALGVPVILNGGAATDFAAGRVRRAPLWLQKTGFEWAYRLWLEPNRLAGRYAENARFIARMMARSLRGRPA